MASSLSQLDQLVTVLNHKNAGSMSQSDRYALANMALDKLGQDLDLYESKRKAVLSPYLLNGYWWYVAPSDLKGDAVIDIRTAGTRTFTYDKKVPSVMDSQARNGSQYPDFTVEVIDGFKLIRINGQDTPVSTTICSCDSITDDGTWAVSNDAINIALDTNNGLDSDSSIRFDVDVSVAGGNLATISTSDLTQVDLSDYEDVGAITFKMWIPDATYVTGATIKFGSSPSDYASATVTAQIDGSDPANGKNVFLVEWTDLTETGTPNFAAVDFLEISLNYSASQTDMFGVRLDDVQAHIGKLCEIVYYSENLVVTSSGSRARRFTDSSDTTVLGSETEGVFINLWAYLMAFSRREPESGSYKTLYDESMIAYGERYPSERPLLGYEYEPFGIDRNNPDNPRYI